MSDSEREQQEQFDPFKYSPDKRPLKRGAHKRIKSAAKRAPKTKVTFMTKKGPVSFMASTKKTK